MTTLSSQLSISSSFHVAVILTIVYVNVVVRQATDTAIANGRFDKEYSRNRRPVEGPALLLLTDGYTASASEILVEALCENRSVGSICVSLQLFALYIDFR